MAKVSSDAVSAVGLVEDLSGPPSWFRALPRHAHGAQLIASARHGSLAIARPAGKVWSVSVHRMADGKRFWSADVKGSSSLPWRVDEADRLVVGTVDAIYHLARARMERWKLPGLDPRAGFGLDPGAEIALGIRFDGSLVAVDDDKQNLWRLMGKHSGLLPSSDGGFVTVKDGRVLLHVSVAGEIRRLWAADRDESFSLRTRLEGDVWLIELMDRHGRHQLVRLDPSASRPCKHLGEISVLRSLHALAETVVLDQAGAWDVMTAGGLTGGRGWLGGWRKPRAPAGYLVLLWEPSSERLGAIDSRGRRAWEIKTGGGLPTVVGKRAIVVAHKERTRLLAWPS